MDGVFIVFVNRIKHIQKEFPQFSRKLDFKVKYSLVAILISNRINNRNKQKKHTRNIFKIN